MDTITKPPETAAAGVGNDTVQNVTGTGWQGSPTITHRSLNDLIEPKDVGRRQVKVFHVATTDPSGAGYNLCQAVNRHTHVKSRLLSQVPNPFRHPTDIFELADYGDEIEQLLVEADILHLHKVSEEDEISIPSSRSRSWQIKDFVSKKQVVYHIHGNKYERANVEENGKRLGKLGRPVLAATPDLEKLYKPYCDVQYFPNCVPINDSMYLPRASNKKIQDKSGKQRWIVAQTTSDDFLKDCDMVEEAVKFVARTQPVNYLKISKLEFRTAMVIKRVSHIVFDHMQGYYGLSSLEGLSLGKPVVAGLSDHTIGRILEFFDIPDILPWQRPKGADGLRDCLLDLVSNEDLRLSIGRQSRTFMENVWSDKAVAEKLVKFYESIL